MYLELGWDVGVHGTHCAGIAAAVTDNATGIAGAGWGCRVMGVKPNDSTGAITTEGVALGCGDALANGAGVLSMSFGGDLVDFGFMQNLVYDAEAAGVVASPWPATTIPRSWYPSGGARERHRGSACTNAQDQREEISTFGPGRR